MSVSQSYQGLFCYWVSCVRKSLVEGFGRHLVTQFVLGGENKWVVEC